MERNRGWFGVDLMLVSGAMAQALKVPQAGGFLVKQVVKDSVGGRIGLKGGDRIGIVEGQQIVVGGDILLSVQGITMASADDRAKVLKALETLQVGRRPAGHRPPRRQGRGAHDEVYRLLD